jgi:hypothetical protein
MEEPSPVQRFNPLNFLKFQHIHSHENDIYETWLVSGLSSPRSWINTRPCQTLCKINSKT